MSQPQTEIPNHLIPEHTFFSDNMRAKATVFKQNDGRYRVERHYMSRTEGITFHGTESVACDIAEDWVLSKK